MFKSCICLAALLAGSTMPGQQTTPANPEPRLRSHVFLYSLADGSSREVFTDDSVWEAPNWSPDGKYLILSHRGGIYELVLSSSGPAISKKLALPATLDCNNDKALSPDGSKLAFSASTPASHGSEVFVANADGTDPKQRTTEVPSYFHGWSPDGKTLAFVAQRKGSGQFDLYTMPAGGGAETELTANPHHDDGPDYSPDGRWIYFNSDRSGKEAAWRLPAASAGPADQQAEMVVNDSEEDWFPHIAPDGTGLVYITYPSGTPTHNSRELKVSLRMVPLDHDKVGKSPKTLVNLMGGQGSMNVNSWAPDSRHFAYVSYERLP